LPEGKKKVTYLFQDQLTWDESGEGYGDLLLAVEKKNTVNPREREVIFPHSQEEEERGKIRCLPRSGGEEKKRFPERDGRKKLGSSVK